MQSKLMSRAIWLAAACVAGLCWSSPAWARGVGAPGKTVTRSLRHAEKDRTFLLHLAAKHQPGTPAPLIIALHGLSMDGRSMELITGFSDASDRHGFAVAYPDGLNRMWRFWERHELGERVRGEAGYVDDVGFLGALIDELVGEGTVDPRRVYVTGLSNGAYMSNRLGCSLANRVAAIAPVAGTMSAGLAGLDPPRGMPVLYIHGTDDRIVGFDGIDGFTRRKSSLTAEELAAWWAERNGCGELSDEELPDRLDDGCRVARRSSHQGSAAAPVVFYKIAGGGHTWPDGQFQPRLLGNVCREFNACDVIWEFFSQQQLPETAGQELATGK